MAKGNAKQEKIRSLKTRIMISNILFVVDLVVVLLTVLFGDSGEMTGVWVVFLFVAAGFFVLSRSARKELESLEPGRPKAAGRIDKHR